MALQDELYLGFDLSTQQLKCVAITAELKLVAEVKVDFVADLSRYGTDKGVYCAGLEVYAPPAMWLDALDLVLQRLKGTGLDMSCIVGLSGAGMQHGVVFWSKDAYHILANLNAAQSLAEQLCPSGRDTPNALAYPYSPNWQDASTEQQCNEFNAALGDPQALAHATGSSAHHRFSGPQIMKFRAEHPEEYRQTATISLVSSFLASVLLGKIAPIDVSDATGMNLFDVQRRRWHEDLIALVAGTDGDAARSLKGKLGNVSEGSGEVIGNISPYFVNKYGFSSTAKIFSFTGDNPATILALPLRRGDAIISLGTSTTFLMSTAVYQPHPEYHMMHHPTTKDNYMFMLCYKNGGLARELIRDRLGQGATWEAFNSAALAVKPLAIRDSTMRLGLYFPRPEIVPPVRAGEWRALFDSQAGSLKLLSGKDNVGSDSASLDCRQIIESQLLSIRMRSRSVLQSVKTADGQLLPPQPRRIYLVGGGSNNEAIAGLCGQVLGSADGVYTLNTGGNACALGGAYKALWGCKRRGSEEAFEDFIEQRWDESVFVKKVAEGYRKGVFELYEKALPGLRALEEVALADTKTTVS